MRKRRALSTVVGAVFAIIALTSTVTYISYSMGILNNYNSSVLTKNQQLSDVNKENFRISSVTVPNSKLNITVTNTGSLPISFTKIWIQNTTTTDWIRSYTPTNNFVTPGGVLKNIGQNIPVSINPANSYNVKLVTSRGNTQQFMMNSPSIAPLNIQFFAVPNSVDIGFNSKLLMIVTNNGSSTLVNISPNIPTKTSGSATCSLGQVNPTNYSTLPPGSSAVFTWNVSVTGGTNTQYCEFTITPPLQNGYSGQSVTARVTINMITFSQTLLAQNTGILTLNYTTFRWTQSSGTYTGTWFTGWTLPSSPNSILKVNVTNNNATGDFYLSANTQVYYRGTSFGAANAFWIVNSTIPGSPYTVTPYTCGNPNDYCIKIPSGQTATLYFGANGKQLGTSSNQWQNLNKPDNYYTTMLIYGKFATSRTDPGTSYAQNLPYIALLGT